MSLGGMNLGMGQTYSPFQSGMMGSSPQSFYNPYNYSPKSQFGGSFGAFNPGMGYAGTNPVMAPKTFNSQDPNYTLGLPTAEGQQISLPSFNPNPPVGNAPPPTTPQPQPPQTPSPGVNAGIFSSQMAPPPTTPMQQGQAGWGWDGGSANNGYTQRFNPRESLYIQQMMASDPSIRGKVDTNNYLQSIGQLTGRQYSATDPQWNV